LNAPYTLRPARIDDADGIHCALWPDSPPADVADRVQRAVAFAQQGRGAVLIAVDSSGVVGYGQLTVWPRVCEISDLMVREDRRGCGIGTAIIHALIEVGRQSRPLIEIGVALSNPRALALYRRLGFQESRQMTLNVSGTPEPVLYLTMEVSPHEHPTPKSSP